MSLLTRFAFLFRTRDRRDSELNEEIRSHFQMAVEDRVAHGEDRDEARRAVRRVFAHTTIVSLAQRLGERLSQIGPAHALATIAHEETQ